LWAKDIRLFGSEAAQVVPNDEVVLVAAVFPPHRGCADIVKRWVNSGKFLTTSKNNENRDAGRN